MNGGYFDIMRQVHQWRLEGVEWTTLANMVRGRFDCTMKLNAIQMAYRRWCNATGTQPPPRPPPKPRERRHGFDIDGPSRKATIAREAQWYAERMNFKTRSKA